MATNKLNQLISFDSKSIKPSRSSQILSHIRKSNLPRPDLVLRYGETALRAHSNNSVEYWDIMEQICRSAAELREHEIAKSYLDRILSRFPHSIRAFTLLGLTQEAEGKFDAANATYESVITKQSNAPTIYKRQIACLKTALKMQEAIAMLNYYLGTYSDDMDAWAELTSLCLAQGRFSHALFAANELIVHDANSFVAHTLIADVNMTCGTEDNIVLARMHYANSLRLRKRGNLRALFGLWLACSMILECPNTSQKEKDTSKGLLDIAKKGLQVVYKDVGGEGETCVERLMLTNTVTGDNISE